MFKIDVDRLGPAARAFLESQTATWGDAEKFQEWVDHLYVDAAASKESGDTTMVTLGRLVWAWLRAKAECDDTEAFGRWDAADEGNALLVLEIADQIVYGHHWREPSPIF